MNQDLNSHVGMLHLHQVPAPGSWIQIASNKAWQVWKGSNRLPGALPVVYGLDKAAWLEARLQSDNGSERLVAVRLSPQRRLSEDHSRESRPAAGGGGGLRVVRKAPVCQAKLGAY